MAANNAKNKEPSLLLKRSDMSYESQNINEEHKK